MRTDGGQHRIQKRRRRFLYRVVLTQCVLCWAGCAGGPSAVSGDPLVGGGPALTASANPAATPKTTVAVPPLPAPAGTASNAALASSPGRPIDGRHDLQITDPRSGVPNQSWAPQGSAAVGAPRSDSPLVTLDRGITPTSSSAAGVRLGSFEQARTQLDARGVIWYRLESGDAGAYKFSCSIPNRHNRMISRTYESQAGSELAAIQAVLDQIDRER